MPLSLTCPECAGKLKVADTLAGKKIKCPKCAAVFAASAPEESAITAKTPPPQSQGFTPTVAPPPDDEEEEDEDEEPVRPKRGAQNIRKDATEDAVSTFIPYKNGRALAAYYCGVFSFIPCVGLILGPAALLLGILGLRYAKAHPTAKGGGHAIAGVVMGTLTSLGYWGVVIAIVVMGVLGAASK